MPNSLFRRRSFAAAPSRVVILPLGIERMQRAREVAAENANAHQAAIPGNLTVGSKGRAVRSVLTFQHDGTPPRRPNKAGSDSDS